MLIIFTGCGKGKTTAALGQALRAIGNDGRVLMVQFIKGPWDSGEHRSAQRLAPHLTIIKKGKGFVKIGNDRLPFEEHVRAGKDALILARRAGLTRHWNILILDEVWNALELKLISNQELEDVMSIVLPRIDHLIMTGRNCPQEFIEKADLVTEMREIKHPFVHGIAGIKSVEY